VVRSSLLVAFLLSSSPTPAADRAPAPRPVHPRFELNYLPKVAGQGVLGIRPAEIARHATRAEVETASAMVFGVLAQLLGGTELDAAVWPTLADIEQCVCCLDMRITAPKSREEQGAFVIGGKTPALIRTVRPFDWDRVLRRTYPQVTAAKHAGRTYLRMPFRLPFPLSFIGSIGEPMAAYTPDEYTLVLCSESDLLPLLDRLTAGKPAPEPPPGWSEVDRDLVAFALDNRDLPLISGRFPPDYRLGRELESLASSAATLAVGLSASDSRTRLRFVATAKDEAAAGVLAAALTDLFQEGAALAAPAERPDPLEAFAAALLKSATLRRDGLTTTADLAADGNLVRMLLTLLRGPA